MMRKMPRILALATAASLAAFPQSSTAQQITPFAYGHFDQWVVRQIKESSVIGGNVKEIYEIGPTDTIVGDKPYPRPPRSPWATSNVMAKVSGVTKASATVFPEKRGNGYCARLDTKLEQVKVLGLINISVLASGTVFLGEMDEPIKDTKNPMSKLIAGVPFTQRPTALVFDYKYRASGEQSRVQVTGFSSQKKVAGQDYADAIVILQSRWEDEKGNVFAKRIGTGNQRFGKNTPEWVNGHSIPIRYGDISKAADFPAHMDLMTGDRAYYCRNSKGKVVPIQEVEWGGADDTPTHLIVQISSSHGGAYTGSVGNSFWVDNVKLAY